MKRRLSSKSASTEVVVGQTMATSSCLVGYQRLLVEGRAYVAPTLLPPNREPCSVMSSRRANKRWVLALKRVLCLAHTMGPRPSISGELPIESYFGSAGRTAGPSGSKENRSLKRKNALDASGSDGERAPTKKHKTKAPSKGSHTGPEYSKSFTLYRLWIY